MAQVPFVESVTAGDIVRCFQVGWFAEWAARLAARLVLATHSPAPLVGRLSMSTSVRGVSFGWLAVGSIFRAAITVICPSSM